MDEELLRDIKKLAAERGTTLTALIEDAVREVLARRRPGPPESNLNFTTFGVKGLRPGIDLDDSAGLLDLMERPDDAD